MLLRSLFAAMLLMGAAEAQWLMETWEYPPTVVTWEQWDSQPEPMGRTWHQVPDRVVLHHSGVVWVKGSVPVEKVRTLQKWGQKEKGWPDLPYHFLISPDGQIFEGRDWRYRPESNTAYDLNGVLNVCLFGNFEEEPVSEAQRESLVVILAYLHRRHRIDVETLTSHLEEAPGQTVCPGRDLQNWLDGDLRAQVRQFWDASPGE